jgi:dihydropteroate synthase
MNTLNCNGRLLGLDVPKVMGILNMTTDSFFDGGQNTLIDVAVKKVDKMIREGASIIDVGGMSSRPGADIIDVQEELIRVLPIIKELKNVFPELIISIDTVHGEVAQKAIDEGASMVNDISGGEIDNSIWTVALKNSVPYILMHILGRPKTMQDNPQYEDVTLEILKYLRDKVYKLHELGLKDIIVDPGFGFGKTIEQNYILLKKLSSFRVLECPILVGLSRKSMIYGLLDTDPEGALNGTSAAHMVALQNGVKILRVHDVKEAKECITIYEQIRK